MVEVAQMLRGDGFHAITARLSRQGDQAELRSLCFL